MYYNIKMTKIKKNAFFYPSQPENTSSASPSDQANSAINKQDKQNNALINLTEGKITKKEGFVNNPRRVDEVHYHHEKVENLKYSDFIGLNPPDGARTQYPFTHRLGNSSTRPRGIKKYENNSGINVGPFRLFVQE